MWVSGPSWSIENRALFISFSFLFLICFFPLFFNWRIIALQYCVGLCHTLTLISLKYIYVPSLLKPSPISHPSHPSSLSQSPGLRSLCHTANSHLQSILYMVSGASGKESACQCRRCKRHRFDPWVRRSPGGGHGNPLQYPCLENPMSRGAWQATVHRVAQSRTQPKQLRMQSICFCATLSITLSFPQCVHKSVLCIYISTVPLQIGLSVPFCLDSLCMH